MQNHNEKPILFNPEMVKAVLDGRKTQTRRVVKSKETSISIERFVPAIDHLHWIPQQRCGYDFGVDSKYTQLTTINGTSVKCPYGQVGTRLWVRETFAIESNYGYQDVYEKPENPLGPIKYEEGIEKEQYFLCPRYKASEPLTELWNDEDEEGNYKMKWKPSIHMPRDASRINLEITDIRVERVQDITEADAKAEGIDFSEWEGKNTVLPSPRVLFWKLWDSINKDRGYGWGVNPWVWVVEFKVV